CARERLIDFW
nr:immunoglobulin heavy chain junction region [Mus musculus]MBK4186502.1 immunoglobulin heavy chain junction region [Mus musculus]MBK4186503.1 immunoglobulin heavy chain junction region [Mus musculus]MBK4186504.1 immunoglobulin heavy chain junction region [Mus musculus]MBK4186507.1 immunoglobulin heavy chain junction region [Mus musculus]